MKALKRAKSRKNGFSLNESLSSCDKYVFWFLNKQQTITTINSYYLILILLTYYLSRDQETYLLREAWKMPSLYPTSTALSSHYHIRVTIYSIQCPQRAWRVPVECSAEVLVGYNDGISHASRDKYVSWSLDK